MTLMLESGIFLAMGLQAFGIIEDADGDGGGLARAAVIAVIAGSLIMVIRALFIALMLTWLDHRSKHRKRRYEAEAGRLEAFEQRMAQACTVDSEVLACRNLSEEQWIKTMARWRRRLKIAERQHAVRRSDIDDFEKEPLGPREASVIIHHSCRSTNDFLRSAHAVLPSDDRPLHRIWCAGYSRAFAAVADPLDQAQDGLCRYQ